MKDLIILVGPPGVGKTTYRKSAQRNDPGLVVISQDEQGLMHWTQFLDAIETGANVIIDRMNFDKKQRAKFLGAAKFHNYNTKIVVLHENQKTCLERMLKRQGHETIKDEKNARAALHTFFTKYERPTPDEADEVMFVYPEGEKPWCIVSDIDNTLSNTAHREHILQTPGRKNWKGFFDLMGDDGLNEWCYNILTSMAWVPEEYRPQVLLVSARPDSYRGTTEGWLFKHEVHYDELIMRDRGDHREDSIVKEQLMDFEILTRYRISFWLDDRKRVIDKIRSRGITVLDCAGEKGNF